MWESVFLGIVKRKLGLLREKRGAASSGYWGGDNTGKGKAGKKDALGKSCDGWTPTLVGVCGP